jgi:DNA-binding CsgD family transcriptional regulator
MLCYEDRNSNGNGRITPREIQILQLTATGATNREVALRLGISPDTVKNRMGGIYRKLGTYTRLEAVLEGIRRGIVVVPGSRAVRHGR